MNDIPQRAYPPAHTVAAEVVEEYAQNMMNEGFRLTEEIRTLKAASEWQLIESAPKDGTCIYGACQFHGYQGVIMFSDGEWENVNFQMSGIRIGFYPTHWMPLPPKPEGEPDAE